MCEIESTLSIGLTTNAITLTISTATAATTIATTTFISVGGNIATGSVW